MIGYEVFARREMRRLPDYGIVGYASSVLGELTRREVWDEGVVAETV